MPRSIYLDTFIFNHYLVSEKFSLTLTRRLPTRERKWKLQGASFSLSRDVSYALVGDDVAGSWERTFICIYTSSIIHICY